MKRKKQIFMVSSFFVAGLASIGTYNVFLKAKHNALFVSCLNHRSFVAYEMQSQFPGNDPEANHFSVLPYDPNLPSYGLFAKYVYRRNWVTVGIDVDRNVTFHIHEGKIGQNCHHGAPGRFNGGWQGLNYAPEVMEKLWEAHLTLRRDGIGLPYFWCGKDNPLGKPRAGALIFKHEDGWVSMNGYISKDHLNHLQACLNMIGEPPIDFDIPDNVEWARFEEDESYKMIPDRIGEDGQVIYRITPKREYNQTVQETGTVPSDE